MKLLPQAPKKAIKAFLKQKPLRSEIDLLKKNLITLLDKISVIEKQPKDESEEHLKNDMRDFLRDTFYKESHAINTKDKKDLVIHLGKKIDSNVGVIIETKRPSNTLEMISLDNANKKALHEIILYYFGERNNGNHELKQLIISNIYEWYIIDANYFDKFIYRNNAIKKLYETKLNDKKDNPWFYEEVAKLIEKVNIEIPCVYINIKEYEQIVRDTNIENDKELSALLKILSPQYLLKATSVNDSNSLNEKFYQELLHIIGLEEAKEGGKNIIRRKKENIEAASLMEMALKKIKTKGIHKIVDIKNYGDNADEQYFHIALELCIVWINRILFLKLLEGQLMSYHYGNKDYCFLNKQMIPNFNELFILFHNVLAVNIGNRDTEIADKYTLIPYLNSSLFEISDIEDLTICIDSLDNTHLLALMPNSILKDTNKSTKALPPLDYLFSFLDAYDFASEGTEEVQEDNKNLINASVLGKVFEKINGYKDGSIFTPAFITMYMCRESIRLAVIEKFNEALSPKGEKMFETFDDVKSYTFRNYKAKDILACNKIINGLHICDPAVGSGHFLVSALNEIISIKAELGILADKNGFPLRDYEIEIVNDELIITDFKGNIVEYRLKDGKPLNKEMQNVQETLFYEKQHIIENCLFGVDINPNSVKICRLRLWIELLKNMYYILPTTFLREEDSFPPLGGAGGGWETLPNIDINIKCGNSLLSRFALDADLSKALKSIKYDIKAYRGFVQEYKNEKNKEVKRVLQQVIDNIKKDFRTEIHKNDPKLVKLHKLSGDLFNLLNQTFIFDLTAKEKKAQKEKQNKLENEIAKLSQEIDEVKTNAIYKNAFEWRFEFPEILSDEGNFLGFDVIVGNPPYFPLSLLNNSLQNHFNSFYTQTFTKGADIYCLFYELGINILKDNSNLCYITSNRFCFTNYGVNLRTYLSKINILQIINFNEVNVFSNVNVGSLIMIIEKKKPDENKIKSLDFKESTFLVSINDIINKKGNLLDKTYFKENQWSFDNNNTQQIKAKIESKGISFVNWKNISINRGVTTGANNIFVIDTLTKEKLCKEDANSIEIIKPLLKGRNIKRYQTIWNGDWIIFTKRGINIDQYPAIKNYLFQFKNELEPGIGRKKGNYKWFEVQDITAFSPEFEKTKLIWTRLSNINTFAISDDKEFSLDSTSFAVTKDAKYLLAILNSKVVLFYFKLGSVIWGKDGIKWFGEYFDNIPIPEISIEQQQPFIELVDRIIELKKDNNVLSEKINEIEKQIDVLVYQLYDISAEEQAVIEKLI